MDIQQLIDNQRRWSAEHSLPTDVAFRMDALNRLRKGIVEHEERLMTALAEDLGKAATEAYMTEVGLTLSALRSMRRGVRRWSREKRVGTPLSNFPARSMIYREPYGVVLVMVPWNYPVLLALEPLIGALAAGNTVMLKFSPYAVHSARAIGELVREVFVQEHVAVIDEGADDVLRYRYDYIFFTGSPATGRTVMKAAAEHLTPVTLELGGKSPCIVHRTADIEMAARRIVFGKYLNCGQTCVAPDYILADEEIKEQLIEAIKVEIGRQYGAVPPDNKAYGKIINRVHYERLVSLIERDKVVVGGEVRPESMQIAPTVMDGVTWEDAVMQQEIFGPILPVVAYRDFEEALQKVRRQEHPLALYIFARDKRVVKRVLSTVQFGGGCVNDTIMHLASSKLPFGGVGQSGMGCYHGRYSFDTFSRRKSVVHKPHWLDLPLRYQPYRTLYDRIIRLFLR